jgi:hypothetical protein
MESARSPIFGRGSGRGTTGNIGRDGAPRVARTGARRGRSRGVDVRSITATNRDIETEATQAAFERSPLEQGYRDVDRVGLPDAKTPR